MDTSYQDQQTNRARLVQRTSSSQADYVPRNDFEAKLINMLHEIRMGQQMESLQVQMNIMELTKRAEHEEQQRHAFENLVKHTLTAFQYQLDAMTVNHNEREKKKTFEADVNQRMDKIASQVDLRAKMMETQLLTMAMSIQSKMSEMIENREQRDASMFELVQDELTATEETIVNRFEQCLKVHEEQSIKKFEEYSIENA